MTQLVVCEHCGAQFEAPDHLAGGIINCPECGKATPVPGLRDPIWRVLQGLGFLLVPLAGYGVYLDHGVSWGVVAGLGTAAVLWLLSKAF